ncbi:hypothetical protein K0651_00640 [Ornithinimicrobium sp. Arc0846-15]|nr:hypothetical protein [Ornithinimicrobium laminariae]
MSDEKIQSAPIAADWLALRRLLDDQARGSTVAALGQLIAQRGPINSVIDVGAGTGANTAWLTQHIKAMGETPRWILLDHDPHLLNNIDLPPSVPFTTVVGDIADVATVAAASSAPCLVSASALLDVLTFEAIDSLVGAICKHANAAILALSVTGRLSLSPPHPFDEHLVQAFNNHQSRGTLSGPAGIEAAATAFAKCQWQVLRVPTPWTLDANSTAMTRRWLQDRVAAASELLPDSPELGAWATAREAQLNAGELRVIVEHEDLLAWPDDAEAPCAPGSL